jgi:phospholipase C
VCVPDPVNGGCVAPFHEAADLNYGGPHSQGNAAADINAGAMNGFVSEAEQGMGNCASDNPDCSPCTEQSAGSSPSQQQPTCVDAMGYHDAREIPNYWKYAQNYVLQDHLFEPNSSWSLPQHLYMVSEWSAFCTNPLQPFSCRTALQSPNQNWSSSIIGPSDDTPHYAWTDLTYLLHSQNVSWGYYILSGSEPDCEDAGAMSCNQPQQNPQTPGIWNPLPSFTDVRQDNQLSNVKSLDDFYAAARTGTLPAVSWVTPNQPVSEHPPALVSAGQAYVTGLINAVMRSPEWNSTAIFLSWDDWGGFYDHVVPPVVDRHIDHQIAGQDAYNRFIEDDFLGGQRLDPATDGRPDPRPDVREANPIAGDLRSDFNFSQTPRPPLLLPMHPPPGPASTPP